MQNSRAELTTSTHFIRPSALWSTADSIEYFWISTYKKLFSSQPTSRKLKKWGFNLLFRKENEVLIYKERTICKPYNITFHLIKIWHSFAQYVGQTFDQCFMIIWNMLKPSNVIDKYGTKRNFLYVLNYFDVHGFHGNDEIYNFTLTHFWKDYFNI